MEVTYQGRVDRVIPFPEERPDLVFTPEERTMEIPNVLAERLYRESGARWEVEPTQDTPQDQAQSQDTTGLAQAIAGRTVEEVMDWVGDNVERARQARRAEMARDEDDQRSTLLEALDEVLGQ